MRIDGSAVVKFLKIVDDDQRPGRDTGIHNPVRANLGPQRYGFNVRLAIRPGHINLLHALELGNGYLRYEQRVMANFGLCLDTAELARAQEISRIRKRCSDSNSAGLAIHLAVNEGNAPLVRKILAI